MKDIEREYSEEFDKLRKSRVYVSYYKYGAAKDNFGKCSGICFLWQVSISKQQIAQRVPELSALRSI